MNAVEWRAATALAGVFALRMLGLFMILPVFALYAEHLEGATPALAGLAIGAYGVTQAILQIPYGWLSDRFGRKRLLIIGLVIFATGSVMAALADSIWGVIAGRALQGAGAIAAVVMATAADLTREEHRTKAMALIGMSIGASFALALVFGPILNDYIGVPGIFWLTSVLAIGGVLVVMFVVPTPRATGHHLDTGAEPAQIGGVIANRGLLKLDFGIFVLHLIMTASFVVLPLWLRDEIGMPAAKHWELYLSVLFASLVIVLPGIVIAEKKRKVKPFFVAAVAIVAVAQFGLWAASPSLATVALFLFIFYVGFNFLEASLPALVSRVAPAQSKGTAMGVYSSSQFFGAFIGGVLGGWLHGRFGIQSVFLVCGFLAAMWVLVAISMESPRYLSSMLLPVERNTQERDASELGKKLLNVPGVVEAVVVAGDETAYLKVDKKKLDRSVLDQFTRT